MTSDAKIEVMEEEEEEEEEETEEEIEEEIEEVVVEEVPPAESVFVAALGTTISPPPPVGV